MEPRDKKPKTVYRIIDNETGEAQGVYSRAYCDEYDFSSEREARRSNINGTYEDEDKYSIAKYKVTYELINGDK